MQAEIDTSEDALLSDVCIGTSSAPTYFPTHYFKTKDSGGNDREFHLVDGGVAANNLVRNKLILILPFLLPTYCTLASKTNFIGVTYIVSHRTCKNLSP